MGLIRWKGTISLQMKQKNDKLQLHKAELFELAKTEELLNAKIDEMEKELQSISNLNTYNKRAYITRQDLNNGTQPGELIMLIKSPIESTLCRCGNGLLKGQCEKYESTLKANLVYDANNYELKNELEEIIKMKSAQQLSLIHI